MTCLIQIKQKYLQKNMNYITDVWRRTFWSI